MRRTNLRNGEEGNISLVWLPTLLALGAIVYSVTLMVSIHNLQHQTDQLHNKLNAIASTSPLINSSLPKGSVSFEQLSPDLQAEIGALGTTNDSDQTAIPTVGSAISGATSTSFPSPSINASNIQPGAISLDKLGADNCQSGQVLQYSGSRWACADIQGGIISLNGLTAASQTIALSRSGTSARINASGNTITLSLPTASASNDGLLSSSDFAAFSAKQAALTFGSGLNNSSNTITSTLTTGLSGGQTVTGGTAAGDNLTLTSTSGASKGKLLFGTSAYDEANNRLGIGTASPNYALDIATTSASGLLFNVGSTSTNLTGSGLASIDWSPASATTSNGNLVSINAGNNATIGSLLNISSRGTNVFTVGQNVVTFGKPVSFSASTNYPVKIIFDNYTATDVDNVILAEAPSNNVTITLPNPAGVTGREYTIKRVDSPTYTISIVSAAGATIDQQNSLSLDKQGNSVELVSDGTSWQIISQWDSPYTYSMPLPYGDLGDTDNQGN